MDDDVVRRRIDLEHPIEVIHGSRAQRVVWPSRWRESLSMG
jgi:hypothetical protein